MIVGQSIDRQDGRRKVLGQAKYAAEAPPERMAHAVLVQSTIAAGTIAGPILATPVDAASRAIDASALGQTFSNTCIMRAEFDAAGRRLRRPYPQRRQAC